MVYRVEKRVWGERRSCSVPLGLFANSCRLAFCIKQNSWRLVKRIFHKKVSGAQRVFFFVVLLKLNQGATFPSSLLLSTSNLFAVIVERTLKDQDKENFV